VPAGIGGGVLFVPLVSGFLPLNLDFVRGAGLLVALSGTLSAAPRLLRARLASLRLALPCALAASAGSLVGATVGLRLETRYVQMALGAVLLAIAAVMLASRRADLPRVAQPGWLSRRLGIGGTFLDARLGRTVSWHVHREAVALLLFVGVGFMAGMFGVGAGWANVPVLNLVMGAPIKVAVATSGLVILMANSTAAWVYLKSGCWMPLLAVPSILGMILGARLGRRVLVGERSASVRTLCVAVMVFAAVRALLRGLGYW
jgi:uncharacterized membrane protein YfcA